MVECLYIIFLSSTTTTVQTKAHMECQIGKHYHIISISHETCRCIWIEVLHFSFQWFAILFKNLDVETQFKRGEVNHLQFFVELKIIKK